MENFLMFLRCKREKLQKLWLMSKWTFLFVFLGIINTHRTVYSQNEQQVTISMKNAYLKDILWEIREDCQVSSIFMIWQTAAPPQRGSTSIGVAVPRYSASARTATIKNGPMPNSSPKTARKIEKRILPLLSPTKANNCRIAPGSFDFITRLLSGHKKYKEGIAFLSTLC